MGSRPASVQRQARRSISWAIVAAPASYPLETQGVAQHAPMTSSGIHTGTPARAAIRVNASGTDKSPGEAKIRFTQAGK